MGIPQSQASKRGMGTCMLVLEASLDLASQLFQMLMKTAQVQVTVLVFLAVEKRAMGLAMPRETLGA